MASSIRGGISRGDRRSAASLIAAVGLVAVIAGAERASACDGIGCVGQAIGQGARETGAAIGEGVQKSGHAVERGAVGVGHVVDKGVDATGRALGDAGHSVDRAVTGQ
jgi:hypothetical protein